jgi:hypothetical protein
MGVSIWSCKSLWLHESLAGTNHSSVVIVGGH